MTHTSYRIITVVTVAVIGYPPRLTKQSRGNMAYIETWITDRSLYNNVILNHGMSVGMANISNTNRVTPLTRIT